MTTYELPPEPPIGSKVHPSRHPDIVWYRSGSDGGWSSLGHPWYSWAQLLGEYEGQGLTLIEPDPWPWDDLIVADWIATGTAKGHGLACLDGHEYVTVESGHVLREGRDTLTNVVPVTVVPTAEWQALGEKVRGFDTARTEKQRRVVVTRAAELLIEATNALGLD